MSLCKKYSILESQSLRGLKGERFEALVPGGKLFDKKFDMSIQRKDRAKSQI